MYFKQIILRKLFRHRIIGGKHTAFEHITASIPKHLHGQVKKNPRNVLTRPKWRGLNARCFESGFFRTQKKDMKAPFIKIVNH